MWELGWAAPRHRDTRRSRSEPEEAYRVGSLSRRGERGRLADELLGRFPLAGPLRAGGITDCLSPGQLSTGSFRSQLGDVDLSLHLCFPGFCALRQQVSRLEHSLGQVLGVWFL